MGGGALASAGIGFWDEGGASVVRQGGVMTGFSGLIPVEQGEGVVVSPEGAEGVGCGGVGTSGVDGITGRATTPSERMASRGCPRRAEASYAREARTIW